MHGRRGVYIKTYLDFCGEFHVFFLEYFRRDGPVHEVATRIRFCSILPRCFTIHFPPPVDPGQRRVAEHAGIVGISHCNTAIRNNKYVSYQRPKDQRRKKEEEKEEKKEEEKEENTHTHTHRERKRERERES